MLNPCEPMTTFWKSTFSSTSPPAKRSYPPNQLSWSKDDDFHQHRPQYALPTIYHTTLYVNHNSLIVLNKFLSAHRENCFDYSTHFSQQCSLKQAL